MKIAILGTRGIPNNYGGFEQFAEYLSLGFLERGHEVVVYNSHNHNYQQNVWKGVKLIHCYDPEYKIGTVGQFIYDLNCILDSRKRKFDLILQLGYTSSSIWSFLLPRKSVIVTNMDGLEWKRTKYGKWTRKFLKYAERLAVKKSDYLISDSIGIQKYIKNTYNKVSEYIAYGADVFTAPESTTLDLYKLKPLEYDLLIARLEPENSIEMILDGFVKSNNSRQFLVIGNHNTIYGEYLKNKYQGNKNLIFMGSIYDMVQINNLRYYSNLYFHGHTVGGTNPSLLEAMASSALIAANRNEFNASVLKENSYYFSNSQEVAELLSTIKKNESEQHKIQANIARINTFFSWNIIIDSYETYLKKIILNNKSK